MSSLTIALTLCLLAALALVLRLWWRLVGARRAIASLEPFSPLFRAVTAAIDMGVVVLDQECQIRYLNPQAQMLLDAGQAADRDLATLVHDDQATWLVNEVLRHGVLREIVLPSLSGRKILLRAVPLAESGIDGAILLVQDITQISRLERARRDLIANVSHDLRTPLASIKLLVETLQLEPPAEVAQRMLTQTAQEIDAVTQLVDELYALAQLESGRVAPQLMPVALAPVIERAVERIRPQAARKTLRLGAEVSGLLPVVLIDADRIGQVLLNLLHNAVKFTPEGGVISLRAFGVTVGRATPGIGYVERRLIPHGPLRQKMPPLALQGRPMVGVPSTLTPGNWVLVTIADTGVGIPSQDMSRIFERFYRADRARDHDRGGSGLGLAIARQIVEGHGGRIWATSAVGAGSTFFFALPVAGDDLSASRARPAPWYLAFDPQRRLICGQAYRRLKRAQDLLLCLLSLPLLLPLMGLIAALIALDSPGPILTYQVRIGKGGRRFRMYRFRTTERRAEELTSIYAYLNERATPGFKMVYELRLTRVGRILSKNGFDELPQIVNVLKGDMSLVGPRPISFVPDSYPLWHTLRLDVAPGVTGLWQVCERGNPDSDQRMKLDIAYIERQSLWLDLHIIARTIGQLFARGP